jgi:methionyl-tRNA formyltransferase
MRFAITATDRYLGVFENLVKQGWEPVKVFTSVVDNKRHCNKKLIECAQQQGLDVQFSRLQVSDLQDLQRRGCDILVVASYNWKIPEWQPYLKYAINFHPSPLPEGRGPYPMIRALLEQQARWGVTCHKLSQQFDAGDILAQSMFPLSDGECHERLDLKIQMAMKGLATQVAQNFEVLWQHAEAQHEGRYIPFWSKEEQTVDFSESVDKVMLKLRAFGFFECMATVNKIPIYIRRAVGWRADHSISPGALVHTDGLTMVVAAKDGYIGILEWSLLDQNAVTGRVGR